jgi:catechol 2,3-dioxygenase-like lactoylglutathione lyase family enzyme
MQLARAVLFVKDLRRMTAFYRDTLGLKVTSGSAGWIELDAGPVALALHAIPAAVAAGIVIETPPRVREGSPVKLSFAVADVAAERTRLVAEGVVMREVRPGSCDGVDPEGNVFQLVAR